jgi:hypothetical protein
MAPPEKKKLRETKIIFAELNSLTSRSHQHSLNFVLKNASIASDEATLGLV